MLTLDISGKSGSEAVEIVRSSLNDDENEIKILIDGPEQFENLNKFLTSESGFTDITLEDDEGILYIIASGRQTNESEKILLAPIEHEEHEEREDPEKIPDTVTQDTEPQKIITPVKNIIIQDSLGIILSYENKKYRPAFMQKFINALIDSQIKPRIIALLDNAVSLAAYDSKTCEDLKALESIGVEVLISDSCADRLGLTEALGTGILSDMGEILAKIFECEKVVSL